MPYKLRITNEEVENELKKLGFHDLTEETIEVFRKDLLKLIKSDLRKLKNLKKENELEIKNKKDLGVDKVDRELRFPTTSTPSLELEKEKVRHRKDDNVTSEYETYSSASSAGTSQQASSLSSESSSKVADEKIRKEKEKPTTLVSVRKKEKPPKLKEKAELPSYPEKPDPVNLYHFYKAHWDKFKVPGEDPRNTLRWDIRSKLFYSNS